MMKAEKKTASTPKKNAANVFGKIKRKFKASKRAVGKVFKQKNAAKRYADEQSLTYISYRNKPVSTQQLTNTGGINKPAKLNAEKRIEGEVKMTVTEIRKYKAKLSSRILYFTSLMTDFKEAAEDASKSEQEIIKQYNSLDEEGRKKELSRLTEEFYSLGC